MPKVTERRFGGRTEMLCLAAVLGVLALHCAHYWPYTSDDALISMRYADRLAHGHGLTYNDGERVEGYTNLLWVLVLAFGARLGLPPHLGMRVFGFLAACGTIVLLSLSARSRPRLSLPRVLTGGAFFALSAPAAVWAIGGLEASLLYFLLALFLFWFRRWTRDVESERAAKWSGLALGLVALTRADAMILAATGIGLAAWRARGNWTAVRRMAAWPAACVGGQLLFRLAYYHDYIPNTARAKVALTLDRVALGYTHVANAWFAFAIILLLVSVAVALRRRAFMTTAYGTLFGVWCAYLAFVGGDIFAAWRLVMIAYLPLYFLVSESAEVMARAWDCRRLLNALLVTAALHLYMQSIDPMNRAAATERWELDAMPAGLALKRAFASKKPLLAVDAAGGLPYWTQFPTLDLLGLNDALLSHLPPPGFGTGPLGHELGDGIYTWARKPDLVVFFSEAGTSYARYRGGRQLTALPDYEKLYKVVGFHFDGVATRALYHVRFRDGRLGIEERDGEIRVPGFLFGTEYGAAARVAGDGTALAAVTPGASGEVAHVPVPAGEWEIGVTSDGGAPSVSVLCHEDGPYTSLVGRSGSRFSLSAAKELSLVVGTTDESGSRVRELVLRRVAASGKAPALCTKTAGEPAVAHAPLLGPRRLVATERIDPSHFVFGKSGVLVALDGTWHTSLLELGLGVGDRYRVEIGRGVRTAYETEIALPRFPGERSPYLVRLPERIAVAGYDHVRVTPLEPEEAYSLSHVLPGSPDRATARITDAEPR